LAHNVAGKGWHRAEDQTVASVTGSKSVMLCVIWILRLVFLMQNYAGNLYNFSMASLDFNSCRFFTSLTVTFDRLAVEAVMQ